MTFDDDIGIIGHQKEREEKERKMENATHINTFINSLPKIVQKKVWRVTDSTGTVVQYVGATDNRKSTAQEYINQKHGRTDLVLTFSHFNGMITLPR